MQPAIQASSVTKVYQSGAARITAVDQVSFEVKQGQIASLVGPNGAGKTTIFNAITGFGPMDKGSITFKGLIHSFLSRSYNISSWQPPSSDNLVFFH